MAEQKIQTMEGCGLLENNRDISIDFLKFVAVFCIVNSHLDTMYPDRLSSLASGGAIGDALFFFCSGFTLLLKPLPRFDQWYKRRLGRIYPTIFAAFLLLSFLQSTSYTLWDVLIIKGFWFVQCILIYYIPIYFIGKYFRKFLFPVLWIEIALFVLVYYLGGFYNMNCYKPKVFLFFYFSFMLFGAAMGATPRKQNPSLWYCLTGAVVSTLLFFGTLWMTFRWCFPLHLISALPLFGLVYYLYCLFRSEFFFKTTKTVLYAIVRWCGGLCLEVYLIHFIFVSPSSKAFFPLNILGYLIIVFLAAYLVKILANFFMQTLVGKDYQWLDMLKVNK